MTLDPLKGFQERDVVVIQQMLEGLVRFSPEGRLEPALAVSWERVDPLRLRFHLRPGVKFHDGRPFSADDVRASVGRLLDPSTAFPGRGFLGPLEKAEVVDPLTVDLVTFVPDALLLNRLAAFVFIQPAGAAAAASPIGTGPFAFESWERGKRIRMKANRSYWQAGAPKVDELVFRFIPEEKKLSELFAGRVDLVTDIPGTRTAEVLRSGRAVVIKSETFSTYYGVVRVSSGPFSDPRVRLAANLAIDRDALIRYGRMGNGRPVATLSMEGEPGHDPALKPYPYDPKRAKTLLKEAGYPHGFSVEAIVNAGHERTAKIVAAQLAKVGILVKPAVTPEAELLQRFKDGRFMMGLSAVPDPMGHSYFIQSISLYSKSPYGMGGTPELDSRIEAVASTLDDSKREELDRELDRYVYETSAAIFGYQEIGVHAARKGVEFAPYRTGMPYFFAASKR